MSELTIEIRGLLDSCWALGLAADDELGVPVGVAHCFIAFKRDGFYAKVRREGEQDFSRWTLDDGFSCSCTGLMI